MTKTWEEEFEKNIHVSSDMMTGNKYCSVNQVKGLGHGWVAPEDHQAEIEALKSQFQQQILPVVPSDTDKLPFEKLQEIRIKELKDFNSTILQVKLENQKLQKQLDSCIQTLIEASASATITQDIVVGNLVDRKLADLAKTHKLAVDYIEKVTGKNIDVVLAENAALEAEEEE